MDAKLYSIFVGPGGQPVRHRRGDQVFVLCRVSPGWAFPSLEWVDAADVPPSLLAASPRALPAIMPRLVAGGRQ
jgi:hypothetical protein